MKQYKAIAVVDSPREEQNPSRIPHSVETLTSYLEALASAAPTPGGGSAACLVAATGAALTAMVARITLTSPKYAEKHEEAAAIVQEADALRALLTAGREADEAAYGKVVAAMKLPRYTEDQKATRAANLQETLQYAASIPLNIAAESLKLLRLTERCSRLGNKHLMSDVHCAAAFTRSALAAAAYNVRANHAFIEDTTLIAEQEAKLHEIEKQSIVIT